VDRYTDEKENNVPAESLSASVESGSSILRRCCQIPLPEDDEDDHNHHLEMSSSSQGLHANVCLSKTDSVCQSRVASADLVLGDKGEYRLDEKVASKLYPHQIDGIKWLWSLYSMKKGGILGDDMGLGELMQEAYH
jgi:SNF2 family DNA or RNA helicase